MGILSDLGKKYSSVAKPFAESTMGLKWVGQSASNFWTGVRVTKPAAALGIGALALYSAASGAKAAADYRMAESLANTQDVGQLPATNYISTGARSNLGATGDLVFGLHN